MSSTGIANATEISLAENVVRAQMHPADEFDAFRELLDGGMSRRRYRRTVRRHRNRRSSSASSWRVSARVSFEAYRKGELNLAHVRPSP